MDSTRFDDVTRAIASSSSRRSLLRGIVAAAALVGFRATPGFASPPDRVDVCHYDAAAGLYRRIAIPERALAAHLRHGDVQADDCETLDGRCAGRSQNERCGPGEFDVCATVVETGQLVCVDETLPDVPEFCVDGTACPAGYLCVVDDPQAPPHCHPPLVG